MDQCAKHNNFKLNIKFTSTCLCNIFYGFFGSQPYLFSSFLLVLQGQKLDQDVYIAHLTKGNEEAKVFGNWNTCMNFYFSISVLILYCVHTPSKYQIPLTTGFGMQHPLQFSSEAHLQCWNTWWRYFRWQAFKKREIVEHSTRDVGIIKVFP